MLTSSTCRQQEVRAPQGIALVGNGISSPKLLLWKPLIEKLISDEMKVIYHTGNDLPEEDNQVIQEIGKNSLIIEEFDAENLPSSINSETNLFLTSQHL